jgi:hypothetical protein
MGWFLVSQDTPQGIYMPPNKTYRQGRREYEYNKRVDNMSEVSALIASYGSNKEVVATTVSIVIKAKKKLLEHKTFYARDFSSMEDLKAIMAYALEHTTNKELGMLWKVLPVEELDRVCPDCGEPIAAVPW